MAFHEVRFPANLSFGSVGGPERRTDVVTLANGFEERNTPWAQSRRHYDAGVGRVGVQGDELREGIHWEVDDATGVITFENPPLQDAEITAGFEFDVPVRFDTDRIATSVASFQAGEVPSVPVVEVRI